MNQVHQFRAESGIARNVLTDRLNRSSKKGIFEAVLYQDASEYEYCLSQRFRTVYSAERAYGVGDQY